MHLDFVLQESSFTKLREGFYDDPDSGDVEVPAVVMCSIEECKRLPVARGWCDMHYRRWRRCGNPVFTTRAPVGEPLAFLGSLVGTDRRDCIEWPYSRNAGGYGRLSIGGSMVHASREMCRTVYGEPPTPAHEAAHSCGNGHLGCVNPNHLRWATHKENSGDMIAHGSSTRGSRHPNSRLCEADVQHIRGRLEAGQQQCCIAEERAVSRSTINDIARRRTWGWLP